jgi:hypothetical protein
MHHRASGTRAERQHEQPGGPEFYQSFAHDLPNGSNRPVPVRKECAKSGRSSKDERTSLLASFLFAPASDERDRLNLDGIPILAFCSFAAGLRSSDGCANRLKERSVRRLRAWEERSATPDECVSDEMPNG